MIRVHVWVFLIVTMKTNNVQGMQIWENIPLNHSSPADMGH